MAVKIQMGAGLSLLVLLSATCTHPVTPPPDQFIAIRTFFKNKASADLLNADTPNSFKKSDIKIVSKVEIKGVVQDMDYYSEKGFNTYVDGQSGNYYLELAIPTNYAKTPIETLVTLSPTVTDTVTYTYTLQGRYVPNQVFYNKVLVWDIVNAPVQEGFWPPITIVK